MGDLFRAEAGAYGYFLLGSPRLGPQVLQDYRKHGHLSQGQLANAHAFSRLL